MPGQFAVCIETLRRSGRLLTSNRYVIDKALFGCVPLQRKAQECRSHKHGAQLVFAVSAGRPEFYVEPKRRNPHGSAILIVSWVRDVLQIDRRE